MLIKVEETKNLLLIDFAYSSFCIVAQLLRQKDRDHHRLRDEKVLTLARISARFGLRDRDFARIKSSIRT